MKRSTERILTTHTGSLPRPWDLTTLLEQLDAGTLADPSAFERRVREAVVEVVRKQIDAGVDVVNDGEQGKVGYSTYVRHRLTGFGGQSAVAPRSAIPSCPDYCARSRDGGPSTGKACVVSSASSRFRTSPRRWRERRRRRRS